MGGRELGSPLQPVQWDGNGRKSSAEGVLSFWGLSASMAGMDSDTRSGLWRLLVHLLHGRLDQGFERWPPCTLLLEAFCYLYLLSNAQWIFIFFQEYYTNACKVLRRQKYCWRKSKGIAFKGCGEEDEAYFAPAMPLVLLVVFDFLRLPLTLSKTYSFNFYAFRKPINRRHLLPLLI